MQKNGLERGENMNKPLSDRLIEEILDCAKQRGRIGEPIDCGKALTIFWKAYGEYRGISQRGREPIFKQRTAYARDTMRDYLWFDDGEEK